MTGFDQWIFAVFASHLHFKSRLTNWTLCSGGQKFLDGSTCICVGTLTLVLLVHWCSPSCSQPAVTSRHIHSTRVQCNCKHFVSYSVHSISFCASDAAKSLETWRQIENNHLANIWWQWFGLGVKFRWRGKTLFSATAHVGHVEITTQQLNGTFRESRNKNLRNVE